MSARDDYPLLALPDVALAPIKLDGQNAAALREIDDLRADHTEAILLFGAATTELSALKARHARACELLAEFDHGDPCLFDHHGNCQAHDCTNGCVVADALEFLAGP